MNGVDETGYFVLSSSIREFEGVHLPSSLLYGVMLSRAS